MSTEQAVSVFVAGSTGSVGRQALEVIESSPGRWSLLALAASGSSQASLDALAAQAARSRPRFLAVSDPGGAAPLAAVVPEGIEVLAGPDALAELAAMADVTLNAVVGFAGLGVTMATLSAGRRLALANKESLVAGAPVVQRARRTPGAELVPVDSEHCALHQCLRAGERGEVATLVLTGSGGPFRGRSRSSLASVTVDEALAHPTWRMGPKITVDSSTLMNKGLEVIEAHELFDVDYDRIEVVIHPQSIVHSMVTFRDGSTLAQLSRPDMRLPVGYALGWPVRTEVAFGALDWAAAETLEFEPPDLDTFRCLSLAFAAGREGGGAPAWLNAANEVAVAAFLGGALPWLGIAEVAEDVLASWDRAPLDEVADVVEADRRARRAATRAIERVLA